MIDAARIAAAFLAACRDELEAPKPGNVHVYSDGHRMTAADFLRSAEAAARPLSAPRPVGARILGAVAATRAAVAANTNLGIILLCAPLAAAAEAAAQMGAGELRAALARVLAGLDIADAALAFRAIVLAAPGGLGRSERHDVHAPATATLAAAMAEAADRDRIAAQYSTTYGDIFALGLPALAAAAARRHARKWTTLAVYMAFLAAFPDSHVVRKHGSAVAEEVRREAALWQQRLDAADQPESLLGALLAWDRTLKTRGINPGTSADLTVATLFAARLAGILPSASNND